MTGTGHSFIWTQMILTQIVEMLGSPAKCILWVINSFSVYRLGLICRASWPSSLLSFLSSLLTVLLLFLAFTNSAAVAELSQEYLLWVAKKCPHCASMALLSPSTLVPLCNSVLFRINSVTAWFKKMSVMTKQFQMTGLIQLLFAALTTEHFSQFTLCVCFLAVSTGYFETYYYFSTKEQCDWMNFKIVSSLEISCRARSFLVGARSNGGTGRMKM